MVHVTATGFLHLYIEYLDCPTLWKDDLIILFQSETFQTDNTVRLYWNQTPVIAESASNGVNVKLKSILPL